MKYFRSPHPSRFAVRSLLAAAVYPLLLWAVSASAQQGRVAIPARTAASLPAAIDIGPIPSSQRITLTLTLAPSADRVAALDQFLSAVTTASSPSYHHWVTPAQFAATFGATAEQISAATDWAQSSGLNVDAVSPSCARISISGFASQIESAFAVPLRAYQLNGNLYYGPGSKPSLPSAAAAAVAAIDGLDNLPGSAASPLSLPALAAVVDANATPILTLDATAATGALSEAQIAGYQALFRQAAAQGITTLVGRNAYSTGFPANLADLTAVAVPSASADTATPISARPAWQNAPGLPADNFRYGPDVTVDSVAALAQTLSSIALRAGGRLGNVDQTLYALAPTPGLYTQTDGAPSGTWEASTGLGKVDLARLALTYPTGTSGSQTFVTSSTGSPIHGQSFTLSTRVASTGGGATPTGTVTFTASQSSFNSTTVTLNGSGAAVSAAYLIPGGTYNITATYSGDSTYASSTGTLTLTVQPEAASFVISAPASVSLGASVTATVTLTSASGFGTPNAAVTVTPSGITGATPVTQTLNGSGGTSTGTFAFTTKQAGNVSLQATCASNDSSFTCFTPQTATTNVPQATPSITLSVSPSSPSAGTPVTLTAAVTGVSGITPSGSVQFFDGTSSLGSGTAPNATYTTALLPGQGHSLTAAYLGDSNYSNVTSNAVSTPVGTASTTTLVRASATTASYGQTITLNITVTGSSTVNSTLPTGTLTFTGAGTTTTAAVSGGSATVSLPSLAVGTYTITTAYSGDTNYSASTGNTVVITVTQSAASLNTSISSNSFTTGSTSTLTVTVTLPGNSQLPSGTTFTATIPAVAAYTGTFTINPGGNTGTGQVTILAPPAGSYTVQVTCGANSNFTCTPATLNITSTSTATSTGTTPTTTVLTVSPTTPLAGQPISLTATVSTTSSTVSTTPIAGSVNFYNGTALIGTGNITTSGTNGIATATTTLSGTAPYSLTAIYAGNATYATSSSAAVIVSPAAVPSSISLSANTSSIVTGVNVTFTAIVGGSTTTGALPTGLVYFYLAGASPQFLGSAILGSSGGGLSTAVFSTSALPAGADQVYAVYKGDTNFSAATSATIAIGITDYSLTFVPQTLTLTQGQTGHATIIVGTVNGFAGTVIFGCTPAPNTLITCSFSPATLSGGGTTTMTVVTTAPKVASLKPLDLKPSGKLVGGIVFAALLCFFLPRRRRRFPVLLLLTLAAGLSFNLGCSEGNFVSNPIANTTGGTPHGTTIIAINTAATDGVNTITHNYSYQVTIP